MKLVGLKDKKSSAKAARIFANWIKTKFHKIKDGHEIAIEITNT